MNDSYFSYIEQQIKYFQEHSDLSESEEITPLKVNTTLALYTNVGVALIGEYARFKKRLYNMNRDFTKWHNRKFYDARKKMTSEYEGKTIKIAVKEVEITVQTENEEEYWKWQDDLNDLELQINFLKGLIDQWTKLDSVLNNLSRNMRQEMISISIENRMNKVETKQSKVRTSFPEPKKRTPIT